MRVMLVNTLYAPHSQGGAARSVQELAEALVRLGHQVMVETLHIGGDDPRRESIGGVQVERHPRSSASRPFVGATTTLTFRQKMHWQGVENFRTSVRRLIRRRLEEFRPDVVHTNNLAGFGMQAWSAVREVPLVHTMRDYYLVCARSQMYRRDRVCAGQCAPCGLLKAPVPLNPRHPDVYIGVSADIVDRHRQLGVIRPGDRSEVVYNWPRIDPALARSDDREGDLVFGLFGRIGTDKGTWLAIDAWRALPIALRERSRLVIAGGASAVDRERLARAELLDPRVQYLGAGLRPEDFYSAIDVSLVPSQWYEPFGRVAAEARLTGVPVIASRVGGLPEAVDTFGGGTLVADFASPPAWTRAMVDAMSRRRTPVEVQADDTLAVARRYAEIYSSVVR